VPLGDVLLPMPEIKEVLRQAQEWESRADETSSPQEREACLEVARSYRRLAETIRLRQLRDSTESGADEPGA